MLLEITLQELWMNPSIQSFAMRTQAQNELKLLCEMSINWETTMSILESMFTDVDELEEYLYNEPHDRIVEEIENAIDEPVFNY